MRSDEGGGGNVAAHARVAQLGEGPALDLPDPLAGEVEVLPHLRKGAGLALVETEAQLENAALALVEVLQHLSDVLALKSSGRLLEGKLGVGVLEEVTQLGVAVVTHRKVDGDGVGRDGQGQLDLLDVETGLLGDLLHRG